MENVKGILTILHDKPTLTSQEKALADKYYTLEGENYDYKKKKRSLSHKKKKKDSIPVLKNKKKISKI